MNEIEKAKARAVQNWYDNGITEPEDLWQSGYEAALAANTWVAIKSADDLPKETGWILIQSDDPDTDELVEMETDFITGLDTCEVAYLLKRKNVFYRYISPEAK